MASSDLQGELTEAERDLKELKESLRENQPVGPLVGKCRALDQVIRECICRFLFLFHKVSKQTYTQDQKAEYTLRVVLRGVRQV